MSVLRVVGLHLPALSAALILLAALFLWAPTPTAAQQPTPPPTPKPERNTVDNHVIAVGWLQSPFTDQPNVVVVKVFSKAPGDGEGRPIAVAVGDLKLQVSYRNAEPKKLELRSAGAGSYIAEIIPTAPGHYVFSVKGTIEGVQISANFLNVGEVLPGSSDHYPPLPPSWQVGDTAARALKEGEAARTEASGVRGDVSAANRLAASAQTDAKTALDRSQDALKDAKAARDDARAAVQSANAATKDAGSAQEVAKAARDDAGKARTDASTAKAEAETAKKAAEQAQKLASEARTQVQDALARVTATQKAADKAHGAAERSEEEAKNARRSVESVVLNTRIAYVVAGVGVAVGAFAALIWLLHLLASLRPGRRSS